MTSVILTPPPSSLFSLLPSQGKGDVFELADKILESWYPTLEVGDKRGVVLLVTSQKEGAVAGGPTFLDAIGDDLLEAVVSENLPGEKENLHVLFGGLTLLNR